MTSDSYSLLVDETVPVFLTFAFHWHVLSVRALLVEGVVHLLAMCLVFCVEIDVHCQVFVELQLLVMHRVSWGRWKPHRNGCGCSSEDLVKTPMFYSPSLRAHSNSSLQLPANTDPRGEW